MVAPTSRQFSGGSWDLRKTERRKSQASIDFPDRRKGERRTFGFTEPETTLYAQPSSFDSKFIEKR
jgi:hypothetical protein